MFKTISEALLIIILLLCLTSIIITLYSQYRLNKEYNKINREKKAKSIQEKIDLQVENTHYKDLVSNIQNILNQNQNGSVDNLTKKIKSMLEKAHLNS